MRKQLSVILLISLTLCLFPSTSAELSIQVDDEDSFNVAGYLILGIAFFGWLFFLGLLGSAIYLIIRKSRRLYEPKHPIRCK